MLYLCWLFPGYESLCIPGEVIQDHKKVHVFVTFSWFNGQIVHAHQLQGICSLDRLKPSAFRIDHELQASLTISDVLGGLLLHTGPVEMIL